MTERERMEKYIEENINNLEELNNKELIYLCDFTERFYTNYSENEISYIQYLFKCLIKNDFPDAYKRESISIQRKNGKLQFVNQYNQLCYVDDDGNLCITPLLKEVNADEFRNSIGTLRKYCKNDAIWKQKVYSASVYQLYDNYLFDDMCAVSIYNNEIINIFNNVNSHIELKDLIDSIYELGGIKAECYDDEFSNYLSLGFCPISVCKWDDRLASKKWLRTNKIMNKDGTINEELINSPDIELKLPRFDIIFFIRSVDKINISYENWLKTVEYSNNYDEAKRKRDDIYNALLRREF